MTTATEKIDLENEIVLLLVTEAVKAGMESPLRDPILEAVEETAGEPLEETAEGAPEETIEKSPEATGEEDAPATVEKSRLTKVVQGGVVFVVLFVVLYVTLRRLTSDEPDT